VDKENFIFSSLRCLKKEPLPRGIGSRELVVRAIEFRDPPRIPYYFLYHPNAAEIVYVGPFQKAHWRPTNGKTSETFSGVLTVS